MEAVDAFAGAAVHFVGHGGGSRLALGEAFPGEFVTGHEAEGAGEAGGAACDFAEDRRDPEAVGRQPLEERQAPPVVVLGRGKVPGLFGRLVLSGEAAASPTPSGEPSPGASAEPTPPAGGTDGGGSCHAAAGAGSPAGWLLLLALAARSARRRG